MRSSLLPYFLILLVLLLTCDSPYDPFNEPEHASGSIAISSKNGRMVSDTGWIDSTGRSITITANLYLLTFIESSVATLTYEDGSCDTLFPKLLSKGETTDSRHADTTLIFRRGGRVVARLTITTTSGSALNDSAVLFLHRSAVKLSALTVDNIALTPVFNDTVYAYTVTVPDTVMYLTLHPKTDNPFSSITINDSTIDPGQDPPQWPLMVGENEFTIKSITDDGKITVAYTLVVTREPKVVADASLTGIDLSGGTLSPRFDPDSLHYYVLLPFDDSTVAITPRTDSAIMTINGKPAPQEVTLPVGLDSAVILATANDSTSTTRYVIEFERAAQNSALLIRLVPTSGSLYPSFDLDIRTYTLIVADTVATIGFTAAPLDDTATVRINDASPDSLFGLLSNAPTPFTVVVTAGDGITKNTYTVTVTRAGSDFTRLVELIPSTGTLVPAFYFDSTNYELRIPSDSTTIRLKPRSAHSLSAVTVNGTNTPSGAWSQEIACEPGKTSPIPVVVTSASETGTTTYKVTVNRAYPLTLRSSGSGTVIPSGTRDAYTDVPQTIRATPSVGFRFSGWSLVSGSATIAAPNETQTSVVVTSAAEIKATFAPSRYNLTVSDTGEGSVEGSDSVFHGVAHTIIATPDTGRIFFRWEVTEGSAIITDSASATTTVTLVSGDATVRAIFTKDIYRLTVTTDGHGTTTGSENVAHGTPVTISARPDTGYHFTGWQVTEGSATVADSTADTTLVTLESGNATVSAAFAINHYRLTLQTNGSGTAEGAPENDTVAHGEAVALTATPGSGYYFFKWQVVSGKAQIAQPDSAATTVTLKSGDATIEAVFTMKTYWLTTATDDKGTVSGTGSVAQGVPAPIVATPDPGYHFTGWWVTTGSATVADAAAESTTVTLETGDATVKATFAITRYFLGIGKVGDGTVTSSDSVNHGVETAISATPLTGNHFVVWRVTSGTVTITDSTKMNTVVVLRSGSASIEAVFAINRYQLTVSSDGNGTVQPASDSIPHGIPDSIKATAKTGYHFVKWQVTSGNAVIADPGAAATTVAVTGGNATVTAIFAINRYLLKVNSSDANGTVLPASDSVAYGIPDSIKATANAGYHFVKWQVTGGSAAIGNAAEAATTVTLTTGNATVAATFAINRYLLTVNSDGHGTVTGSDSVSHGVSTTITATPNMGFEFVRWQVVSGSAAIADSTAESTGVTVVSGDAEVEAVFRRITFLKMFGGADPDEGRSVEQTEDGGYIVVGNTMSSGAGSHDVYLIKTDQTGDTIWTKALGGLNADYGRSILQTADGGFVSAGNTFSFGPGIYNVYLIKISGNGNTLWSRTYGGSDSSNASSIRQTIDGGYIVAGFTTSYGAGSKDVYLIKTNESGDTAWTKTVGGTGSDLGNSALQTIDEGYLIAGSTDSYGAGDYDVYLIKTDAIGDTAWTRTYGGANYDMARSIRQTVDGGYVIIGSTTSFGHGSYDVYLIKIDGVGDTIWTRTYGSSNPDIGYDVQQTTDGGFIMVGSTSLGVDKAYLIKTDEHGDTVWTKIFSSIGAGNSQSIGFCVEQTIDGGYVITGFAYLEGSTTSTDVLLIKTDENGNVY